MSTVGKTIPDSTLVERWRTRVEASYAHNSRLYGDLADRASGDEICAFLLWDSRQPPFFRYLEQWLPKAPAAIRGALEAHIREEIGEDHSGLFRAMMAEVSKRFTPKGRAPDEAVLSALNYTFSPECAAKEGFGFFCGGFFATEIMSARRCAQLQRGLERAGVKGEPLRYLELHAEGDMAHVQQVERDFLEPFLRGGGDAADVERGLADRLARSESYLRWYEKNGRQG